MLLFYEGFRYLLKNFRNQKKQKAKERSRKAGEKAAERIKAWFGYKVVAKAMSSPIALFSRSSEHSIVKHKKTWKEEGPPAHLPRHG